MSILYLKHFTNFLQSCSKDNVTIYIYIKYLYLLLLNFMIPITVCWVAEHHPTCRANACRVTDYRTDWPILWMDLTIFLASRHDSNFLSPDLWLQWDQLWQLLSTQLAAHLKLGTELAHLSLTLSHKDFNIGNSDVMCCSTNMVRLNLESANFIADSLQIYILQGCICYESVAQILESLIAICNKN